MQMKTNKNGVKLLAAAMVMVMAFAAVAVVVETSESDAASSDITYLGGTITGSGDQVFGPGSNVIVEKDLVIPADKTLIIGGKFTVNEGAELTIKGKLFILPGASATINADVTVEDKGQINNAAYYDGTNKVNGSYIGFFLNAELNVAKGGIVKGVDATKIKNDIPSTTTNVEVVPGAGHGPWGDGTVTVTKDARTATTTYFGIYYLSSDAAIPYKINGAGNYGYWVGLDVDINDAKPGSTVKVTYDGRASDSTDTLSSTTLQVWVSAGTVNNISVQYTDNSGDKKTVSFTIDSTNCIGNSTVSGEIIVNNGGSFVMNSSKTNPSLITGQTILLKEGATADLNGKVSAVTVSAAGTGIYSYGSVTIPTNSNTDVLTLSFGSISEKIGTAYVNDDEYTKAVNNILLVSGTIENKYTLQINKTDARAGIVPPNAKVLYYADENGDKTNVPITGTVRIAEGTSLKVLASGAMDVKANAILEVDGTLSATGKKDAENTTDRSTATLSGKVYVSGTVNIDQIVNNNNNKGAVALTIASTAYLVIVDDGTISIKEYEIDTSGWTNCPAATLGATFVDDDKVFHVMSLPAAIAYAEKNDVKDIDVWSIPKSQQDAKEILAMDCVIDADLTIPDDISIMIDAVIVISKGATLTISEDAEYASYATARGGLIVVEGDFIDYTMTLLNYGISQTTSLPAVDAEVMFIDSAETYYRYTTLTDALNGAAEGSTIELFGNVDVKNNLTIGKGITVLANGKTLTVENDSELVVEGVLDLVNKRNGSTADGKVILIAKTNYKAAGKLTVNNIVVIGGISSINEYTASTLTTANKYVAGFYAYGTIGDLTDENFILAPAVAAANSKTLEDLKVYTKTTYSGDLVFDGGDEVQTITVDANASATPAYTGNLKVGKITLRNYNLIIDEGALFNGTVAGANGAIEAVNIMGANGKSVTFSDVVDTDKGTDILSIAGTPEKVDSEGKKTAVNDKNTATMSVIDGTIVSEIFTASSLKSFNINEGTVLEISSNSESVTFTASEMTVDGTVNVMKNGTLNVTTLTINGTVYVKVATADDSSYGSITATTIYVGTNSKAMTTTGAAATLSADAVSNLEIIYVADGAIVSEKILKGVNSTEFYVEDALWMTAYQKTGSIKVTSIAKAPVTNADFKGWETADGKEITTTNNYDIGATGAEKVYAVIDYNVYNVKIVGDNGIGTVSIDGVVLMKVSNTFVLADKITAGTHTIIVELKNGYTGTVVMTMDGKTLSDGKFTLSGDKTADRNKTIILSGTEPIVEPETPVTPVEPTEKDDGMGITEYLLIVLVVLAAILVVIVAIRMMRS